MTKPNPQARAKVSAFERTLRETCRLPLSRLAELDTISRACLKSTDPAHYDQVDLLNVVQRGLRSEEAELLRQIGHTAVALLAESQGGDA